MQFIIDFTLILMMFIVLVFFYQSEKTAFGLVDISGGKERFAFFKRILHIRSNGYRVKPADCSKIKQLFLKLSAERDRT